MESPADRTAYDVVVVGGGHNGLVAAAYLGLAGKSVLLIERDTVLGGATQSKKVFPDYDAYLSTYSYLVSLFPQRIVDDLGLDFKTKRRQTASFTPYRDRSGSERGLLLSNVDPFRSQSSMRDLAGDDGAWRRYRELMSLQETLASHAWPSLLEPLRRKADFESQMTSSEEKEAWRSFVLEPLGRVIERYADSDVLRGLIMTDGKIGVLTEPHDPSLLQNRCFLYHVIGGGNGEWRVPIGGMRSLVDALVHTCRTASVELLCSASATRIVPGPDRHEVCFDHDGREFAVACTHVLVNAGARTFDRLLGRPWQPSAENEGSVIKINMLLRRLPRVRAEGVTPQEAFAGSFHFDEGYDQMIASYRSATDGNMPNPAPGEIYCHTLTDPTILSPELQGEGFHTLTLFGLDMPYRLFKEDHDAQRERVLDLYLDGLDQVCAEPFRDCLALDSEGRPCIEIKTPQDLEREIDLDLGNIFHTAPSWFFAEDDSQAGSWGVETAIPRVLRAGASALRGGAVSGIPGHNAAMCVLGR